MSGETQSRVSSGNDILPPSSVVIALLLLALATSAAGQVHGVPPSVTSIQFHVPPFLPNAMPSVTSLGPSGYAYRAGTTSHPYGGYTTRRGYGYGRKSGHGYNTGASIVPYYVPVYDTSAGYDSGSSDPYLYSGPPAEQTLHIVVDLPPGKQDAVANLDEEPPPPTGAASHLRDAAPVEPTLLVFRDGHRQKVTNYAIMGQTVYVFDERRQRIPIGDLDVPATVKANDDRGVEFQLPKANPS